MKIGIIGAGKVGCSIGKYMTEHGLPVAGYFSRSTESSEMAGTFTGTSVYEDIETIVKDCDVLCIATPDDVIGAVWTEIRDTAEVCEEKQPLKHKTICHFSGSYSSDVFSGIEETGAFGCSVHPMSAFSDKFTSYKQLNHVFFTMEGDKEAVFVMEKLISDMGNRVFKISPEKKALYHCAASVVSNDMIGLFQMGLELLSACGIHEEDGRELLKPLVEGNIRAMFEKGPVQALTGPVERGDLHTVEKHLSVLDGENREVYRLLGRRLLDLAEQKNPDRDYEILASRFENTVD